MNIKFEEFLDSRKK